MVTCHRRIIDNPNKHNYKYYIIHFQLPNVIVQRINHQIKLVVGIQYFIVKSADFFLPNNEQRIKFYFADHFHFQQSVYCCPEQDGSACWVFSHFRNKIFLNNKPNASFNGFFFS